MLKRIKADQQLKAALRRAHAWNSIGDTAYFLKAGRSFPIINETALHKNFQSQESQVNLLY